VKIINLFKHYSYLQICDSFDRTVEIGTNKTSKYIIFFRGGDILVAPSSWQWANPNEYIYEKLPDGIHTLIIACSAMLYHAKGYELEDKGT
jgi:hypothetical protein